MEHAQPLPMSSPNHQSPETAQYRAEQAANLSRAVALLKSPEFAWFLEKCVVDEIVRVREVALDPHQKPKVSRAARHVHEALVRVQNWTEERRNSAEQYLNSSAGNR